jgi:hypothetical protein
MKGLFNTPKRHRLFSTDFADRASHIIPICPTKILMIIVFLCFSFILPSCLNSKNVRDPEAGSNLGFEFGKDGFPVNWILYQPSCYKQKISLDTSNPKEGNQSLRIDVLSVPAESGPNFPGFTNEFMEETKGGGRYRIRFWVKNHALKFRMQLGGVKAKESAANPVFKEESAYLTDWKQYEFNTEIPPDMWLRFEVLLKGKGSFWIDGVEIQKL